MLDQERVPAAGVRSAPASASATRTAAEMLVEAFCANGVSRIFGLPGGGSSLDLIEAAHARGIEFVLARHECAAVLMAAVTAELEGGLGVALTTKGPGTANAANGVAYASLDRAPLAVVTDGFTQKQQATMSHQIFDQRAFLAPLVKGHSRLEGAEPAAEIRRLIGLALTPRRGPVHFELTGPAARSRVDGAPPARIAVTQAAAGAAAIERARTLIAGARKPVLIAGLDAREAGAWQATRALVEALGCPALTTYKAKGVIADADPRCVGLFTGGAAEQPTVKQADLIILAGVDPVEFILQPWPYDIPVLDIGEARHPVHYVEPAHGLYGDLAANLAQVLGAARPSNWDAGEIAALRAAMRASLAYRRGTRRRDGLTPEQVVAIAAQAARGLPRRPRATVDAGAHMFSATAFWPCELANDLLISNGLATMGFALPAAIAAALSDTRRPALAFTGDGGLLMCLGELATAVQARARVITVVFNDGSLSLIDIKQQSRELPARGVRWLRPDFAATMRALGGRGYRVSSAGGYRRALALALRARGPALIDVRVDPSGYADQLKAMRG